MRVDPQRVLLNVRQATTEDLLNRVTAFRAGMEPEAIVLIEAELEDRGVTPEDIDAHAEWCFAECIIFEDGIAAKCSFCHRPAVEQRYDWHRLFGIVPLFPRTFYYCTEHRRTD